MREEFKNKIKVLVVDDHIVVREGLLKILSRTPDVVVAGEAEDGQTAMDMIRKGDWDVVVLDISMPGKSSLDVLKEIRGKYPKLPVLILSMYSEDRFAVRYLKAGASGYLTKNSNIKQLVQAIRQVHSGDRFISSALARKLAFESLDAKKQPHDLLSDREYQVMCLIASGKTLSEIAESLSLSPKTISTYRNLILEKMKMKNNAQVMLYAIQKGIVTEIENESFDTEE